MALLTIHHKEAPTRTVEERTVYPTVPLRFEPELWNDPRLVDHFNCYSYALNTQDHGWVWLGGWKDPVVWLQRDGFEIIREHAFAPDKHHIAAYHTREAHFYRLDGDRTWSHKMGSSPAVRTDKCHRSITSLCNAVYALNDGIADIINPEDVIYLRVPEQGMVMRPEQGWTRAELLERIIKQEQANPPRP